MTDFKRWTMRHRIRARPVRTIVGLADKLEPRSGGGAVATIEQFLMRGVGEIL
jgi:hypothetical protein